MQLRRLTVAVAAIAYVALAGAAPSFAQPDWAPVGSATIQPGNETITDGAQCTSNFVFHDAANNVYVGQAAHCSGTGGATETNGCDSGSLPNGTPVEIENATQPGTMVYNSWIAMQQAGETNAAACDFNDFALVRVHPADAGSVNPTIPFWGGPTGMTASVADLSKVLSYGNSSLRLGLDPLKPKEGVKVATEGGGWSHGVDTGTPGLPGHSGRAFIHRDRGAVRHEADEEHLEAADVDGVAVLQFRKLDPLPVAEHAVQAAVVEYAGSVGVAIHERVAPRHRRIVEADVGRQAATDSGPALLQRDDAHAVAVLEGEVVARTDERLACLLEPFGRLANLMLLRALQGLAEQRRAPVAMPPALRAPGHRISFVQGYSEPTRVAAERAGPRQGSGAERFHWMISPRGGGGVW